MTVNQVESRECVHSLCTEIVPGDLVLFLSPRIQFDPDEFGSQVDKLTHRTSFPDFCKHNVRCASPMKAWVFARSHLTLCHGRLAEYFELLNFPRPQPVPPLRESSTYLQIDLRQRDSTLAFGVKKKSV